MHVIVVEPAYEARVATEIHTALGARLAHLPHASEEQEEENEGQLSGSLVVI